MLTILINSSDVPAFSSISNSVSLKSTPSPRDRSLQPFWIRERPAINSVLWNLRFATLPRVAAMNNIRSNKMSRSVAYLLECAALWACRCRSQSWSLACAGECRCSGDRALIWWTFGLSCQLYYHPVLRSMNPIGVFVEIHTYIHAYTQK